MSCFGFWKKNKEPPHLKQQRREEKQRAQDRLRQTEPNGLLEIAAGERKGLKRLQRRQSFTAADPGRFYKEGGHWTKNEDGHDHEGTGGRRVGATQAEET